MQDRPPTTPPRLRRSVAFLLRRVAATLLAAVLLGFLMTTTALLLLARLVIAAGFTLAGMAARVLRLVARRAGAAAVRGNAAAAAAVSSRFARSLPAVSAGTVMALRGAARRERRDISRFLGTPVREAYQTADDGTSPPAPVALLRDPATWRDLAYWSSTVVSVSVGAVIVTLMWLTAPVVAGIALDSAHVQSDVAQPRSAAAASANGTTADAGGAVTALRGTPAGATQPAAEPRDGASCRDVACWWSTLSDLQAGLNLGGAALVTLLAPRTTRFMAMTQARMGAALLGPTEQVRLQAELEEQRTRRRLMVEAAEAERRRIERDLHDGAQQRLVALAMSLGMARRKLTSDPEAAAQLLDAAHEDAKLALGELRTLARGIHPAVLEDRGLDAALSALAGRVGVPVDVEVAIPRRLPSAIESAAYFVVAEALTNVARHAAATAAMVQVTHQAGTVVVEIGDDGVGGADPVRGTGLAGLAGRIEGLDGRLSVISPAGGPTLVRAELPCAS